jgi:hypothetical protein
MCARGLTSRRSVMCREPRAMILRGKSSPLRTPTAPTLLTNRGCEPAGMRPERAREGQDMQTALPINAATDMATDTTRQLRASPTPRPLRRQEHRVFQHRTEGTLTRGADYVTIPVAAAMTGYSAKAIRRKIEAGVWLEGREFRRAPDGHVLISVRGYESWVERGRA